MAFRTLSSKKFGPNKLVIQILSDHQLEDYPRQDMLQVALLVRSGRVFQPEGIEYFRAHEISMAMDAFDHRKASPTPDVVSPWCRNLRNIFGQNDFRHNVDASEIIIAKLNPVDQQVMLLMLKQLIDHTKNLQSQLDQMELRSGKYRIQ